MRCFRRKSNCTVMMNTYFCTTAQIRFYRQSIYIRKMESDQSPVAIATFAPWKAATNYTFLEPP